MKGLPSADKKRAGDEKVDFDFVFSTTVAFKNGTHMKAVGYLPRCIVGTIQFSISVMKGVNPWLASMFCHGRVYLDKT